MKVDSEGFRASHELADKFKFLVKARVWKPLETDSIGQTVFLDASGGTIQKARASLLDLGFQLYVKGRLRLRIGSTLAPFLTWDGGSVGPGVPTPKVNWIIVSFRDSQPPIAFGFERPGALIVEGKAGDWTLSSQDSFEGWIRVSAPTGIRPFRTTSASELGAMLAELRPIAKELFGPPHRLVETEVFGDLDGVTARFRFDRPRAMLPSYWVLAQLGGYDLKVLSGISYSKFLGEDGPAVFADTDSVRLRFPIRRVPLGRSVVAGFQPPELPATVSALDWRGVSDLALPNLFASADEGLRSAAKDASDSFFEVASYVVEPWTRQRLPYGPDGDGLDAAAAGALLLQVHANASSFRSEPNSLFESILQRVDWRTGLTFDVDRSRALRTAAMAAAAGGLSSDATVRMQGAQFEAATAADRGYAVWRRRRDQEYTPLPMVELPAADLRHSIFGRARSPLMNALASPVRCVGGPPFMANVANGKLELSAVVDDVRPRAFMLSAGQPLKVVAGENIRDLKVREFFGEYRVVATPTKIGRWSVVIVGQTSPISIPSYPG